MKARVKATGDIVEATYIHIAGNGVRYYDIDKSGYTMTEDELDFDFSYTPDYWTRLEHQYAGMAMQGILACEEWKISPREGVSFEGEVVLQAHELAHALIQKLKEKEERK